MSWFFSVVHGLELVGTPARFLVIALFAAAVFGSLLLFHQWSWRNGYKVGREYERSLSTPPPNRERNKLSVTKKNITGEFKNALEVAISKNYRWGHLLRIVITEGESTSNLSVVRLGDCHFCLVTINITQQLHVGMSTLTGWKKLIQVNGPNDNNLKQEIGWLMYHVRQWSPTPTDPKTVA